MFQGRGGTRLWRGLRAFIWPQKGFLRVWKYLALRLSRLNTSRHAIAAGFAAGVSFSITPLLGLHIVLAGLLTFVTRGSYLAAILGTFVGNPLTFPFFFAATYWVGARLQELAATDPSAALDKIATDIEKFSATEVEADAAADAVLDVAEHIMEGSGSLAAFDPLWPALSTMLVGAAVLAPIAYALTYFVVRNLLSTIEARRGAASAASDRNSAKADPACGDAGR